jgi:hypothetical protein
MGRSLGRHRPHLLTAGRRPRTTPFSPFADRIPAARPFADNSGLHPHAGPVQSPVRGPCRQTRGLRDALLRKAPQAHGPREPRRETGSIGTASLRSAAGASRRAPSAHARLCTRPAPAGAQHAAPLNLRQCLCPWLSRSVCRRPRRGPHPPPADAGTPFSTPPCPPRYAGRALDAPLARGVTEKGDVRQEALWSGGYPSPLEKGGAPQARRDEAPARRIRTRQAELWA